MLIRIGFLIGTLWLAGISTAMSQATTGRNIADHLLMKEAQIAMGTNASAGVVGTPYLNDAFAQGEVYFDKGKRTVVPARYNIYEDWVEYQQNNQTYILDPDQRIKKVKIKEHVLVVDYYQSKGKIKSGYFTLLDSGKVILLSKQIVTFREQQAPKALEASATPAKYARAPDQFYFKIGNGLLKKVDNIKNMIADFPDKQEELKEFVKEKKISPRKEDELIQLVQYYNTL